MIAKPSVSSDEEGGTQIWHGRVASQSSSTKRTQRVVKDRLTYRQGELVVETNRCANGRNATWR